MWIGIPDEPSPCEDRRLGSWQYAGMTSRYLVRPDAQGFTVFDLERATAAMIASQPQVGLSRDDADHTADLLNRQDDVLKSSRAA